MLCKDKKGGDAGCACLHLSGSFMCASSLAPCVGLGFVLTAKCASVH